MSILTNVIDFIAIQFRNLRQAIDNKRRKLRRWLWHRRQAWLADG